MEKLTLKLGQVCVGSRDPKCRRIPHNSNASLHHMARYRWNQAWHNEVQNQFLPVRLQFPKNSLPFDRPQITFTLYTMQLLDQDNARTACKPLLDALKAKGGIGVIEDDGPQFILEPVYLQQRVAHRAEEHVEIRLEVA